THTANLGQTLNNYIGNLTASKGYFSNNVRLEWTINGGLSQVDNFEIERAVSGSTIFQSIGSVVDNLVFEDETAVAGTFYTYRVYAKSTCNDLTSSTNSATDLGFRQPFGIVNGHVAYSGGNAVEGVTVNFESQDGAAVGKSVKFDGDGDYVAIEEFYYEGTDYKEMTVETWFKTSNDKPHILAASDASDYWRLYINNGLVSLIMESTSAVISTDTYSDGEWHHVAVVYDNGIMRLYMDGEEVDEVNTGNTTFGSGNRRFLFLGVGSEADEFNSTTGPNDWFDGNLDEFRLWSVARTEDEIKRDYNRLLSNEQAGLEIYYRFDEGTGNQVFDASKNAEIFNKNDGTFVGGANFSDEIPDAGLLGIKGVTNEFGDYTADYIPYLGSGDVFRVVPAFGQHAFEPGSRSIYLGDGASVQNDVDFTDISSFTVSGKVTYENSEVPVEGVSIYIDGRQAVDSNSQAVRTDNDGNYTVDVPIGRHFLTAVKDKHTFSEGYFPALNEFGDIEKHEFTEDLTVNFTDDTKITVAGRVVGGNVQGELPLGFDLSTNNVDVATVEFQLQLENYDLDITDDAVYNIVSVTTDPYSGEYSIELIPEKWIINQAGNQTYFIDPSDIAVADLTNSLDPIISTTEVENGDGTTDILEYEYHHDLSFIIQTSPVIEVLDGDGDALHGADQVEYYNQLTEQKEILPLGDDSPFLHDVYVMTHDYDVNIYVHELYENPNHPGGALVDKVPVKDADITINNQLMFNPEPTQGTTDENGLYAYVFTAGFPSLQPDGVNTYTKTFEVEASVNGIGITWNQGNIYRAHVLGAKPDEGTDFITYGPDQVDIVLRDPPGSNSYAYIEQGSSFSSAEVWNFN
ncbi:MAG: LamG domain-containing protein, partial [Bacteroidota bacterium]